MRAILLSLPISILLFTVACGYVGPVLPPSPQIPPAITDLSATERGDKIVVTFTTPARTTDGVAITKFSDIDLRVGLEQQSPDAAKEYSVDPPSPSDRDDPQPKFIGYSIPVSDWTGHQISISVRTSVRKTGHFSGWSNTAVLQIVPPLEAPIVHAEGSAAGIVLTWGSSEATQYRIQRQGPSDKQPLDLATVNENRYVDVSAQYDTEYRYLVTANLGSAESLASEPITFSAQDVYPPAVPSGLTALVGADSVNLAWHRNSEPDFQGYYIYRSTNGGPFERQGDLVTLPTFADHAVEHGNNYSYKISAIDKKGNLSAQSGPADVQY